MINSSSGVSYASTNRFPHIINGDYLEGGLTSNLMTKDVVAYVDHVRELGVPCLNAAGPLASFGAAANLGYGELISNRVVDAIGDLAGGIRLHLGRRARGRVMTADAGGVATGMVIGFVGLGNMGIPMTTAARRGRVPGARLRHVGRGAWRTFAGHRPSDAGGGVIRGRRAWRGRRRRGRRHPDAARLGHRRARPARPPRQRAGARPGERRGRAARQPARGATVIDMSSSDPARTQALAPLCAAAGVTLIDAPVSGGVAGARAGTLAVMVGGPAERSTASSPCSAPSGRGWCTPAIPGRGTRSRR